MNILNLFFVVIVHFPVSVNFLSASNSVDIYLTRHAEKQVDGTKNPALTNQGHHRAKYLANLLKSKNIKKIYSTQYKRTMQTAQPLAQLTGIKIENYNPEKLKYFSHKIKNLKQNALIVGHSNTTVELVALMGGKPLEKIEEKEYDRLYLLKKSGNKITTQFIKMKLKNSEISKIVN